MTEEEVIRQTVSDYFGFTVAEVLAEGKHRSTPKVRFWIIWYIKELLGCSSHSELCRHVNRDRSTMYHGLDAINARLDAGYPDIKREKRELDLLLEQKLKGVVRVHLDITKFMDGDLKTLQNILLRDPFAKDDTAIEQITEEINTRMVKQQINIIR